MNGDTPIKVVRIFKLLHYLSEFPAKTVEKIAKMIDVSPKTIYKDLHIIESLGYEVVKDHQHRYHLKYSSQSEYHLDDNEKKIIIGLIKEAGLNTNDITSITQKLKSKIYPDASNFKIMKQLNIVKILVEAIAQKMVVNLIDYKSTTPGSLVRDRHVLPLYFDEMKMTFTAFDMVKRQPRLYKVSRMKDISLVSDKNYGEVPEELPLVDAFGYAGNMDIDINLLLSNRAAAIINEEFLMTRQYISKNNKGKFPYKYQAKVCGYEGIGRFVLGMMTEIKVIGDEGFKEYLKDKITKQSLISGDYSPN